MISQRSLVGLAVAAVVALACSETPTQPAGDLPEFGPSFGAANVVHNVQCLIDGSEIGAGLIEGELSHTVETKAGTTILYCMGSIPEEFVPDRTVRDRGFDCNTFLGNTTKTQVYFTPRGDAIMTCRV